MARSTSSGTGPRREDLDDDGWLDIYVANDSRPNFYFRNAGDGAFTDEALGSSIALNEEGRQEDSAIAKIIDFAYARARPRAVVPRPAASDR